MSRLHAALCATILALISPIAFAGDFPREGNPAVPNGVAAPFIGQWSVGFPDDETTIATSTLVGCDDPLDIALDGPEGIALSRKTDIEPPVRLTLKAFAGRTNWLPVTTGLSSVIFWLDADSFYRYEVSATGKADWDWPFLHRRCD